MNVPEPVILHFSIVRQADGTLACVSGMPEGVIDDETIATGCASVISGMLHGLRALGRAQGKSEAEINAHIQSIFAAGIGDPLADGSEITIRRAGGEHG